MLVTKLYQPTFSAQNVNTKANSSYMRYEGQKWRGNLRTT